MITKRIVSITGSRSDYWRMRPIYKLINDSRNLSLFLIITGQHLEPEGRDELTNILEDNFGDRTRIPMFEEKRDPDEKTEMAKSIGRISRLLPSYLKKINPDLILLQGDRIEVLAIAIAASIMNIPVIHMSGGDYSGTIDDSVRNAISKFAHVHLTTCESSSSRLVSMGENAERIFMVGEPGLDAIRAMSFISKNELEKDLKIGLSVPTALVTIHPVTTEVEQAAWQTEQLMRALVELQIQSIVTPPNTDAGSKTIQAVFKRYTKNRYIKIMPNLGAKRYLSLMRFVSVVVGNSSSGILEAPSFKTPVVNIGTRQYGRVQAINVINVNYDKNKIIKGIKYALHNKNFHRNLKDCQNPYGDGHAAEKTIKIINSLKIDKTLLEKWIRLT